MSILFFSLLLFYIAVLIIITLINRFQGAVMNQSHFTNQRASNKLLLAFACMLFFSVGFLLPAHIRRLSFKILSLSEKSASSFKLHSIYTFPYLSKHSLPPFTETVHVLWPVEPAEALNLEPVNDKQLERIKNLSSKCPTIVLSLTNDNKLDEKVYLSYYQTLRNKLEEAGKANIQFVLYPSTKRGLNLCLKEDLVKIGIAVQNQQDIDWLNTAYKLVHKKKEIVVLDSIKNFYRSDIPAGVKAINQLYYTLAINYPEIENILVPYTNPSETVQYTQAYDSIKFIKGSFRPLKNYTLLSDRLAVILWHEKSTASPTAYVHYKWNNSKQTQAVHYPYALQTDTKELPDGLNRLKITGFDHKNKALWRKTVTVNISNNLAPKRSLRKGKTYSKAQKPIYNGTYIPVLMYHAFSETITSGQPENIHVTASLFEKQLQALLRNNYTPVSFYDLDQYLQGKGGLPEKPVIITADDGYLNNYSIAYPLLKKYNVPATFFVSTAFAGHTTSNPHFSWEEALEMEKSGLIDIQIHGYNHIPFTKLSKEEIKYQVSQSLGLIEKHLGTRDVVVVAYPELRYNHTIQSILKQMKVNLQVTNLVKRGFTTYPFDVKRINVSNTMSDEALISAIDYYTTLNK